MRNEIDIILQGPYDPYVLEIANHYSRLRFVNDIIISCWDKDSCPDYISDNIKIVKSQDPTNPGAANRNRQIISSLEGIKRSSTEFVLRLRNDQKITLHSMEYMYDYYFDNCQSLVEGSNNRIGVFSYCPPFPFHPRDYIWFGNIKDMLRLWDIPLDDKSFLNRGDCNVVSRPEVYIAVWYFALFDSEIKKMAEDQPLYLTDKSPLRHLALEKSSLLMEKLFLPFGKVDLDWPEKNIYHDYPYDPSIEVWRH